MKKMILSSLISLLALPSGAWACEVCQAQEPKILRGLTHGSGPQGNFDFVIVSAAIAIVLFTLIYATKCLVRPGEHNRDHIKRIILNPDHSGN